MSRVIASQYTGLVLAGGRGTRLGGADKGLLPWRGRPLVAQVVEALRPQVARITISANRHAEVYAAYGPVLPDHRPGFPGPLAGIEAGLAACQTDWLVCVPCDAAGVPRDLVSRLAAALDEGRRAAYAQVGADALYPLCLLHRSLAPQISAALDEGRLAVRTLMQATHAVAVPLPWAADGMVNVNDPESLARLQAAQRGAQR